MKNYIVIKFRQIINVFTISIILMLACQKSYGNPHDKVNTFIQTTKQRTVEFEKLFTTIKTFFDESKNPSLYHYINDNLKGVY